MVGPQPGPSHNSAPLPATRSDCESNSVYLTSGLRVTNIQTNLSSVHDDDFFPKDSATLSPKQREDKKHIERDFQEQEKLRKASAQSQIRHEEEQKRLMSEYSEDYWRKGIRPRVDQRVPLKLPPRLAVLREQDRLYGQGPA